MSSYDTTVSGAAASVLSGLARSEAAGKAQESEQNRFLTLLTTQLKNQDPMNPLENAELTSQLAQMSTVDGIERLNKLVQSLVGTQEISDSAALLGHGVLVEGKGLGLTDAGAIGGFELGLPADSVVLNVYDANGSLVNSIEFTNMDAGSHNYVWDGTTTEGTIAAAGMYQVSVSASFDGAPVFVRPLEFGPVTSVIRGASGADLQVGALGIFKLDDIKQIL
ncbi:MAG: flagellar hook assembly protein FlgD [Azoarcus sp.]|jgi:flagellar basal-body rod modification protein FlgD|nr:flagellar hook assembly protein FlgD [Azoarcus sp.]